MQKKGILSILRGFKMKNRDKIKLCLVIIYYVLFYIYILMNINLIYNMYSGKILILVLIVISLISFILCIFTIVRK